MTVKLNRLIAAAMLALLCGAARTPAHAVEPAPVPEVPAVSAFDAIAAFAGFDAQVAEAMDAWHVPGMAIGAVKDGELVYARGFGLRNVEQGLPVTEHTVFPIGSITKSFTTLLLAQLVDEGRIDWDAPVRTYLPTFELSDPYISAHVTLRDMCSHRTGLPRHDGVWFGSDLTRAQIVERLRYLEFSGELREHFEYNNLLYMATGYVAETVTGQTWPTLIHQRILQPLGMESSSVSVAAMGQGINFSRSYNYEEPVEGQSSGWIALPDYETGGAEAPAGAVNSSIVDMAQYALAQLGQLPSASPGQLRQMHTAQITFGGEPSPSGRLVDIGYGLGWMNQVYRGHYCVHHDGTVNNFNADLLLFPRDRAAVIVLVNTNTPLIEIVAWDAVDRVLGLPLVPRNAEALQALTAEQTPPEPEPAAAALQPTSPAHPLSEYAGHYAHPAYGEIVVAESGGALTLSHHGASGPLNHENYEVFAVPEGLPPSEKVIRGFRPQFVTDRSGLVSALTLELEPAIDAIVFKRVIADPADDPAFLAAVLGDYSLDGLVLSISLGGESLRLMVPGEPLYDLVPNVNGGFSVGGLSGFGVRFILDPAGGPAKLVLVQPDGEHEARKVVE